MKPSFLFLIAVLLCSCSLAKVEPASAPSQVQQAIDTAREAAAFLDAAAAALGAAHEVARHSEMAATALDAGDYSAAVKSLQQGLAATEGAGIPVPPQIAKRLEQAAQALGVAAQVAPVAQALLPMLSRSGATCAWSGTETLAQGASAPTCNGTYWTKTSNVSYGPNSWNVFDRYVPKVGAGPWDLYVLFHPGGWSPPPIGSKNSIWEFIGLLCDRPAVVVSVEYRNRDQGDMLTQIHDATAFLRYATANAAALSIDPARIVVMGASVGGHMASMVGLGHGVPALQDLTMGNAEQDWSVKAIISLYAPTDFPNLNVDHVADGCAPSPGPITATTAVMGCNVLDVSCATACAGASPLGLADAADPPVLLMHGTADCFIPPTQSERLHTAIDNSDGCVATRLLSGAAHGGSPWLQAVPRQAMVSFLNSVLQ